MRLLNRKKNRKEGFDYSRTGSYFLTIRIKIFSDVLCIIEKDYSVTLSTYGKIIDEKIIEIPQIFENIQIVEYVIMPDHVHILLNQYNICNRNSRDRINPVSTVPNNPVSTVPNNPDTTSIKQQYNYPPTISSVVSWLKGSSSFKINKLKYFRWQRSFHDRIVRNSYEFIAIQNYIINNPVNWRNEFVLHNRP